MKAFLLLISAILVSYTTFSQDIQFISLEYSTAVIPEYAYLKVSINRTTESIFSLKVESASSIQKIDPVTLKVKAPGKSVDKEVAITEGQFQTILKALQKIKQADIIGGPHSSLLDGASCSISFGKLGSSVSYHANTPNYDTDSRNLKDFLSAYKLILRTAELDPDKVL